MKKYLKHWMLLVPMALSLAACVNDGIDNPVTPVPVDPEPPEEQGLWAQFDTWKTDSCTAGDDFYMHMIGTWWKNPVDIYPNGMIAYAKELNKARQQAIIHSNPNLMKLSNEVESTEMVDEEGVKQIVNTKVEELWAGAVTREEALAAIGRAWAEGYSLGLEPIVKLKNGVPTWQLYPKLPPYVTDEQLFYDKQEKWRFMAHRPSVRMESRTVRKTSDLDIIIKAMNIGLDHVEVSEYVIEQLQTLQTGQWSTVEGIREEIERYVTIHDGVLVSDKCLEDYNKIIPLLLKDIDIEKEVVLTRQNVKEYVVSYMASLYSLDDYNRQYITPKMRQQYTEWCQQISLAMRHRLEANTWMEGSTRQNAIDKLDNILYYVGGIDVIPDCVIPTLTGKDLIDDVRQLRKARLDGFLWAVGQPRSKMAILLDDLWYYQDLTTDNASYHPDLNIVCINPSNLCEPYVDEKYDDALQWSIATTIGHELTHAFDSDGAKYDLWGNEKNWWTEADAEKFKVLCDQLTENYNTLQLMPWADPTIYGDGKKTLDENIADIGGCSLALDILLSMHPDATDAEKKALTRRFFQGKAIMWSKSYDLNLVKEKKAKDVHSLFRERVNGVVRNIDAWYDAYDISSGALYLPPANRVNIW